MLHVTVSNWQVKFIRLAVTGASRSADLKMGLLYILYANRSFASSAFTHLDYVNVEEDLGSCRFCHFLECLKWPMRAWECIQRTIDKRGPRPVLFQTFKLSGDAALRPTNRRRTKDLVITLYHTLACGRFPREIDTVTCKGIISTRHANHKSQQVVRIFSFPGG